MNTAAHRPRDLGLAIAAACLVHHAFLTGAMAQTGGKTEFIITPSELKGTPGDGVELSIQFRLAKGTYIDRENLKLSVESPESWKIGEVRVPKGTSKVVAGAPIEVLTADFEMSAALKIPAAAPAGAQVVKLRFFYVTCTGNVCIPVTKFPELNVVVSAGPLGQGGGTAAPAKPVDAGGAAAAETTPESPGHEGTFTERLGKRLGGYLEEGSYAPALLLAFLGGILLALTPCVLPMVPIVVKVLVGGQNVSKGRRVVSAIVYTIGLSLVYATLGLIAGWFGGLVGAVLQSPWVLLSFAIFFGALALSMFGLFELQVPQAIQNKLEFRSRGDLLGALVMGMISGLIASPCIGPVLVSVLAWIAREKNAVLGFVVLFTMGLGLGSPFVGAAYAGGRILKPGPWMIGVKKILGILLLVGSAYFINLTVQWTGLIAAIVVWSVLGVLALRWLARVAPGTPNQERATATVQSSTWAVLMLAVFGVLFNGLPSQGQPKAEGIAWRRDVDEALKEAQRNGKPAWVYFTADWCVPCKELAHGIFTEAAVIAESQRFVSIKADITRSGDPQVEAWLRAHYSPPGPPIIFFYDRSGRLLERDLTDALNGAGPITKGLLSRMKSIR